MSKYRLSFLENGGYRNIDLSKLDCMQFKPAKPTDIRTIDELTMSFKCYEDFLEFLKRNKIIDNTDIKLEITIDKKIKHNKQVYNKPIYNSDKLLFKYDYELYNPSYILKQIKKHIYDVDYICKFANNYEEKYKNAYNRITGASTILGIITSIKVYAIRFNNMDYRDIKIEDMNRYQEAINKLLYLELFKSDIIKEKDNKIKIKRRKDEKGNYIKNYRGLHDIVNLIKELEPIVIKEEEIEPQEEFLTMKDFRPVNRDIALNYNINDDIYIDGNDCYKDFEDIQEVFRELQRSSRKLTLKKGDGERVIN